MRSTRVTTVLVFVAGSVGMALAMTADSTWVAFFGSSLFMGSLIAFARHFWRKRESTQKSGELRGAIHDLGTDVTRMEVSIGGKLEHLGARNDALSRGLLEYVAQLEVDLEKTMTGLEQARRRIEGFDQQAARHREQVISQVTGVIGIYSVLKPRLPYPPFGGWAIGGDCARRLVTLILTEQPNNIIEVGSGLSTLCAAQALEILGGDRRIVSLEHDKTWLDRTMALLAEHGVGHRVLLHHAPLIDHEIHGETFSWYDLAGSPLPDLAEVVFVDGPPMATGELARYPALPLLIDRLGPGGVLLMDDAHRADERAAVDRWRSEIPDLSVIFHPDAKGTVEVRRAPT